ncbi:cytochrome-c peroxidase [Thalassotalea euphylliae]|uniref:cytochrome-c peroxidase n=1 Tax=Thalassotalea euphylliae TaxID=1655234 RepID=UPI00362EC331
MSPYSLVKTAVVSGLLVWGTNVLAFPGPPPAPQPAPNGPIDQQSPQNPPSEPNERQGRRADPQPDPELENSLQTLVTSQALLPINTDLIAAPDINDPLPQLGKQLFFAKNLGGEQSVACVSCHHPTLGGADDLSLPVGVSAVNFNDIDAHDVLGQGRFNGEDADNLPSVPRNAPTIFNIALLTQGLFWDSRIERTPSGDIITPDSEITGTGERLPDSSLPDGATLAAAQARFPVTSVEEMRGSFLPDADGSSLRSSLAQRFDNSLTEFMTNWAVAFEQVFEEFTGSFDQIAHAIGEYERSMVFVESPWQRYLQGDINAITDEQKRGALLFFNAPQNGGAGCVFCHNGPAFTDGRHHLVAFPQMGPGKGNESSTNTSQDFGRENVTGDEADRFHFRTPSLLNIATSAPYGHSGAYQTLEEVVRHYNNPTGAVNRLFGAERGSTTAQGMLDGSAPFCELPQVASIGQKTGKSCHDLYPDAYQNSRQVTRHLRRANDGAEEATSPLLDGANLSGREVEQLVAFLHALTDPCTTDRECLNPWIIDEDDEANFPDNNPLIATNDEDQIL